MSESKTKQHAQKQPAKQVKQDSKAITAKAKQLSEELKVTVYALSFIDPISKEQVVGYVKEPTRQMKMYAMDQMTAQQPSAAGAAILEACLLKEHSDPRLYTDTRENDAFYLGAVREVIQLVKLAVNQVKI